MFVGAWYRRAHNLMTHCDTVVAFDANGVVGLLLIEVVIVLKEPDAGSILRVVWIMSLGNLNSADLAV